MEEPLVLSNGLSYDKKSILSHTKIKGFLDPVTREKVKNKFFRDELLRNAMLDFKTKYFFNQILLKS